MDNIINILGENKVSNGINTDINTRLLLEQQSELTIESNLFYDISQDDQFNIEKQDTLNFRFYGKITPIINTQAYNKFGNKLNKINLDTKILSFDNDNWSVSLIKPTTLGGLKGAKQITNGTITYDFTNGLPALPYAPQINTDNLNKGFILYLGHNFLVGDRIYVTSADNSGYIVSGFYTVTGVNNDIITIDENYVIENGIKFDSVYSPINNKNDLNKNSVFSGNIQLNDPTALNTSSDNLTTKINPVNKSGISLKVNNIGFNDLTDVNITDFISPRPSFFKVINPTIYIRKVKNNEILEYYIKKGVVISVLDSFDNAGFSLTPYDITNKNFTFNDTVDVLNLTDNLNYPLNSIYLGIIKNGSNSDKNFSDLESNFSKLIDYTNVGDGFEKIFRRTTTPTINKPKVGDEYILSLCEYSTESLSETEIIGFNHRFIHNDVLFYYNPFFKIKLRPLSNYVDNSDNNLNIPNYSIYSTINKNYIWKNFYDIGSSDDNGDIIDFPFLNNSLYSFSNINFFLNIEKNKTLKYDLGVNDLTGLTTDSLINDISNLTDIFNSDTNTNINNFIQYTNKPC